jgi:hypothetical protein
MKKIIIVLVAVSSQLRRNATSNESVSANARIGGLDIAGGLKEALNNGISKQVTKLTATDGFFRNEAVKILLPEELRKVDAGLRRID